MKKSQMYNIESNDSLDLDFEESLDTKDSRESKDKDKESNEKPTKRARGRPRKVLDVQDGVKPEKRGRGRPRKVDSLIKPLASSSIADSPIATYPIVVTSSQDISHVDVLVVPNPVSNSVAVPIANPIANPISDPVANPIANPIAISIADPVANPIAYPLADPISNSIAIPIANPIADSIANPLADPIADPIANPIANPIADSVVNPISDSDPFSDPFSDPVANSIISKPIADPIADPISSVSVSVSVPISASIPFIPLLPIIEEEDVLSDIPSVPLISDKISTQLSPIVDNKHVDSISSDYSVLMIELKYLSNSVIDLESRIMKNDINILEVNDSMDEILNELRRVSYGISSILHHGFVSSNDIFDRNAFPLIGDYVSGFLLKQYDGDNVRDCTNADLN